MNLSEDLVTTITYRVEITAQEENGLWYPVLRIFLGGEFQYGEKYLLPMTEEDARRVGRILAAERAAQLEHSTHAALDHIKRNMGDSYEELGL